MNVIIITGASSGIGREFVLQLDKLNADEIWGIALNEGGLAEVGKEIKTPYRSFALDLTDIKSFEKYKEILEEHKPNITWLVNCSGYGCFGSYNEVPIEKSINLINLNCSALVRMTELSLPYMKENAKVVEIGSMAGFQSTPYMNMYGASKAFVLSYSRGLNAELKNRKINVTCVCPLWTKTQFISKAEKSSDNSITKFGKLYEAKDVVAKAIRDIKKRKEISTYGCKSKFMRFFVKVAPHKLISKLWLRSQGKS
ncbi:MAG: SDR family NAD(P)-dependent oxidoreductase [Clostridia bacterium]|nr:SDR family NAD(P)-dependent oxidoreductase [Clostridia bacterium]MDD4686390.1 SDR family NAD(P)-dependent oxidoreductase [Clostridia bacterium]